MIRAYIETDPVEAEYWCLVILVGRREFYVWWDRWPHFMTYREPK